MRPRAAVALVVVAFAMARPLAAQDSTRVAALPTGRIAGRIIDRETGRPLAGVRIEMSGGSKPSAINTDLDGRYRSEPLPVGTYALRATYIGYQAARIDSVSVLADRTELVNVAMKAVPFEMEAISVEAQAASRPSSDAGLLAIQRAAPTASDGISAEAISRSPDSDAADAVARITGVAVLDDKFVVIRGLGERYSNTLLNGVELPSPEPLKRVVPLDIFPASLLEAVVTSKAATPDRPGDFAGGSVDVRTKEFPDHFVLQIGMSQGWNSLSTFEQLPLPQRGGLDFLGIDDGRRAPPALPPAGTTDSATLERFGEGFRNVWTPGLRRAPPNTGFNVSVGGQVGSSERPVGFGLSFTYGSKTEFLPDRLEQVVNSDSVVDRSQRTRETQAVVDWGAVFNLTARLGSGSKVGWKNLYTRNAEETIGDAFGFVDYDNELQRLYTVKYIERAFLQSQLTGDHLLRPLLDSRLEWKATWALATRDEPDSRSLVYVKERGGSDSYKLLSTEPNYFWVRLLDDRLYSGQADWAVPFSLHRPGDGLFKTGALFRVKHRDFDSELFEVKIGSPTNTPGADAVSTLPPELAFAPENIGSVIQFQRFGGNFAHPYKSRDRVAAAYAQLDLAPLAGVRVVGGLRAEDWDLYLQGASGDPIHPIVRDYLWSANVTVALSERANLRFAAFRAIARPDPREIAPEYYVSVGVGCATQGNPTLRRAAIDNFDARWEVYPRAGEMIALSAFYKRFHDPIVEQIDIPGSSQCVVRPVNADQGTVYGTELEARRQLDFLPGVLKAFYVGVNLTLVGSEATHNIEGLMTLDSVPVFARLPFQGQSPYLANVFVGYTASETGLSATLLLAAFGDRVIQYGRRLTTPDGVFQVPHVQERGRFTMDAKIQQRLGRTSAALALKNLTNAPSQYFQDSPQGPITTRYLRSGVSATLSVGYDF